MKKKLRSMILLALMLIAFVSCSSNNSDEQISKIKVLSNEEQIQSGRLFSYATNDGFEINKEYAFKMLESLTEAKRLEETKHNIEYYYNEIKFYDSESNELLTIRCINPSGSKENRQVIINEVAYKAEDFYKVLYDIGKKQEYYLDLDKF
ncbi:MAG: hypothetical protein AAGU75_01060 [Bacillota bacterium]